MSDLTDSVNNDIPANGSGAEEVEPESTETPPDHSMIIVGSPEEQAVDTQDSGTETTEEVTENPSVELKASAEPSEGGSAASAPHLQGLVDRQIGPVLNFLVLL